MLSSEYGWSTEYILERTLFEINWRVATIIKRLNLKGKFEMAIHGVKSNSTSDNESLDIDLTDDQKKAMEIAKNRAKERKRLEFLNRSEKG